MSKTNITGKKANDGKTEKAKFSVPLKHSSNFWRTLEMPLINCVVSLSLTRSKKCVIADETTRDANPGANLPVLENNIQNNRHKYRSEMTKHDKTNNLNYLIDLTFNKANRLFVLSFETEDDRTSFLKYYATKVKIKDFNVLIDGKSFFDVSVENKQEAYEKIFKMNENNDYTTGNLLDYKLIAIDLRKQIELENPDLKQQINFIGKLERNEETTMFFIIEKPEETTFEFSQNSVSII